MMDSDLNELCTLQCNNGGFCALYPFQSNGGTSPVDGTLTELCVCPLGYIGITCSEKTDELEKCHHVDGTHVCRHGGTCTKVNNFKTQDVDWVCDCEVADRVSSFAGAMCRNPATEYCPNSPAFCTNGGTCVKNLVGSKFADMTEDCICPTEYTGPHCEFLKVLVEKNQIHIDGDALNENNGTSSKHASTGAFISALFVLVTLVSVGIWWKRRKSTVERSSRGYSYAAPEFIHDYGEEANFEDDEYVMQEVSLT